MEKEAPTVATEVASSSPPPPKKAKPSNPYGDEFYGKLAALLVSKDPESTKQIAALAEEANGLKELWDSGDELAPEGHTKLASVKKKESERRLVQIDALPEKHKGVKEKLVAPTKKPASEKADKRPIITTEYADSEDSRDVPEIKEKGEKRQPHCAICGGPAESGQNLLECDLCSTKLHPKCAQPEVTPVQAADPRFLFTCEKCLDDKKATPSSSAASLPTSSTPSVLEKPKEKPEGTSGLSMPQTKSLSGDLSATFAAFKKQKERQQLVTKSASSLPKK